VKVHYGVSPTFFIVEGTGVLVRQNMTITQTQMLLGLSQVVQRIDAEATIRYLTPADLDGLSTTDAHFWSTRDSKPEFLGSRWCAPLRRKNSLPGPRSKKQRNR